MELPTTLPTLFIPQHDTIHSLHKSKKEIYAGVWSNDWKTHEAVHDHPYLYANTQLEWETHKASHYGNPEHYVDMEDGGELFFGDRLQRFGSKVSRVAVLPIHNITASLKNVYELFKNVFPQGERI